MYSYGVVCVRRYLMMHAIDNSVTIVSSCVISPTLSIIYCHLDYTLVIYPIYHILYILYILYVL